MVKKVDFLDLLKNSNTTFDFETKAVKSGDLKKILEAGRFSPSSQNSQPWKFIVVKNEKTIDQLMKSCVYGAFYKDPPLMIAVVLEPLEKKFAGLAKSGFKNLLDYHRHLDISLPVMNMYLETNSLGLNGCIVSPEINVANKILKVSKNSEAILLLGIGHKKKGSYTKNKERRALKDIVFYEKYGGKK